VFRDDFSRYALHQLPRSWLQVHAFQALHPAVHLVNCVPLKPSPRVPSTLRQAHPDLKLLLLLLLLLLLNLDIKVAYCLCYC